MAVQPTHPITLSTLALGSTSLRGILCLTDGKPHRCSQARTSQAQTQALWGCRAVFFPTMGSAASRWGPHPFLRSLTSTTRPVLMPGMLSSNLCRPETSQVHTPPLLPALLATFS